MVGAVRHQESMRGSLYRKVTDAIVRVLVASRIEGDDVIVTIIDDALAIYNVIVTSAFVVHQDEFIACRD
jgi:hypothetical protein